MKIFIKFTLVIVSLTILNSLSANLFAQTKFNGIYKTSETGINYTFYNDSTTSLKIDTIPVVSSFEFMEVKKKYNKQFRQYELYINLTKKGSKTFAEVTKANIGKPLAIIINDKLLAAPIIQIEITDGKLMVTGLDKALVMEIVGYFKK